MKILAIDTSTMTLTCAVMEDDKLLGEMSVEQDMSHSENLIPIIDALLNSLRIDLQDIDLYAVAVGPGSFTGLRIGLATMKAFSHLFKKPIIGVSTIEALAYNSIGNKIIIPMLDARRDRVYSAIYSGINSLDNIEVEEIYHIEDIIDLADRYEEVLILGNGFYAYENELRQALKEKLILPNERDMQCSAASIAKLGYLKYKSGDKDDPFTLVPTYLRKSQAQRELDAKRSK